MVIKDLGEERHEQQGTWGFGACIRSTGFEGVCDFKVIGKASPMPTRDGPLETIILTVAHTEKP